MTYKEIVITEDNWNDIPSPLPASSQVWFPHEKYWSDYEWLHHTPIAGQTLLRVNKLDWLGVLIRWPVSATPSC